MKKYLVLGLMAMIMLIPTGSYAQYYDTNFELELMAYNPNSPDNSIGRNAQQIAIRINIINRSKTTMEPLILDDIGITKFVFEPIDATVDEPLIPARSLNYGMVEHGHFTNLIINTHGNLITPEIIIDTNVSNTYWDIPNLAHGIYI